MKIIGDLSISSVWWRKGVGTLSEKSLGKVACEQLITCTVVTTTAHAHQYLVLPERQLEVVRRAPDSWGLNRISLFT